MSAVPESSLVAPASDEFELSLFGPGVGECVVVHLGANEWMVVDSCCAAGTKRPAALNYLSAIGVDVAQAVKVVVVSHWHDDHIRGASQIVEAAVSAKFFCSDALASQEFLKFLSLYSGAGTAAVSSGVDEMLRILTLIKERDANSRSAGPEWTGANTCLWRRGEATVHSLSPSAGTKTLAMREFGDLIAAIGPRRRAVAQTKNEIALALHVEVGGVSAILGSDLEESADPNRGWQAVVASSGRPRAKAQVFKVPHHGSETGHSQAVYDELLSSGPVAVLTTFASGSKPLPTAADIARIKTRVGSLFVTSPPAGWNPPRRETAVEKTIKAVASNRRAIVGAMGHVRVRCQMTAPSTTSVQTFGSAISL